MKEKEPIKIKVHYTNNPFRMKYPIVGFRLVKKDGTTRVEGNVRVRQVITEVLEAGAEGSYFLRTLFPKQLKLKPGDNLQMLPKIEGAKEYQWT